MAQKLVSSSVLIVGAITWIATVGIGIGWLTSYQVRAGAKTQEIPQWPTSVLVLPRESYALTIFLHPECPCSRASVAELDRLLARWPLAENGERTRVQVTIIGVLPAGSDQTWMETPTMRLAERLPNVQVMWDANGTLSRAFGAKTSGYTTLYGSDGKLLFAGGITAGRGHEGDNAGVDAILTSLAGKEPATRHTPTYGCALLDEDAAFMRATGSAR